MDLQWEGRVGYQTPELHVFVKANGGWHCLGNDVHYTEYPDRNGSRTGPFLTGEFHDRYGCGMRMRFSFGGSISVFDLQTLIIKFTSLTVLLALSNTVVAYIAYSIFGYRSKLYARASKQDISVEETHAKVAIQAAVASVAFEKLAGPDGLIRKADLQRVFKGNGIDNDDAERLAAHIMVYGEMDDDHAITFGEFLELFVSEQVDVADMLKNLEKPEGLYAPRAMKADALPKNVHKELEDTPVTAPAAADRELAA